MGVGLIRLERSIKLRKMPLLRCRVVVDDRRLTPADISVGLDNARRVALLLCRMWTGGLGGEIRGRRRCTAA